VRIEVVAAAASLRADAFSSTVITARARDAHGNLAGDAPLAATARGSLGPFRPRSDGAQVATYTAPRQRRDGADTIQLTSPGTGANGTLVVPLEAPPRRFSVTLRGGYLGNFGKVSAPQGALAVTMRLPWLGERILLGVESGIFGNDHRQLDASGAETVTVSVRGVPVLARVGYEHPLRRFSLALGGLAGVVVTRTGVASPSAGSTVLNESVPAYGGFVGVGLRVPGGRLILEVGYLYAAVSNRVATGNVAGLGVTAGYRLEP
jgi:hypothetical protein